VRRLALAFALALATLAPVAVAYAAAPSVDSVLQRLAIGGRDTRRLEGEFTQRNRVKLFKQELRSTGRFAFEKPRRVRWEYVAPDPSVLVVDEKRATLTTPGAAPQVFDLERDATMRTVFDQLLLWMGAGAGGDGDKLRADYDLSTAGTDAQPTLILTPKPTSPVGRAFTRIELRLDGKTNLLRSILLVEKNGDEKEITFSSLKRS
jgi:outer membrane lipoprotein-sorting protein